MGFRIQEHGGEDFAETHEINVTPFIDVMLVLLIIFMVAAPLATVNIPLELPVSSAKPETPPAELVVFSIQADNVWAVGDQTIDPAELAQVMNAATKGDLETRIFIRADKTIAYEDLMEGMNALRDLGYLKVSLVGLEGGGE